MTATRRTALAAALAFASATAASAAGPVQPLYIFLYRAGPAWKSGQPMTAQALGPHAAFIQELLKDGRLVAGGPMLNIDGGMAIVRAASEAEARALLASDPAVTAGVFVAELHTWAPRFDSGEPLQKR